MPDFRKQWSDDHGADGLRDKFAVYKASDREPYPSSHADEYHPGDRVGGPGPDDEFVMVLRPSSDAAAWSALLHYARAVKGRSPQLAADIRERLHAIMGEQA